MIRRPRLAALALAGILLVITGLLVARGLGPAPTPSSEAAAPGEPMPRHAFSAEAREALAAAYVAADAARALLAADRIDGLGAHAEDLVRVLTVADRAAGEAPPALRAQLHRAQVAAEALGGARSVDDARHRFEHVARHLVAFAEADPSLTDGWVIYECPMWHGFGKWFQREGPMANPYMGTAMLACGTRTDWVAHASPPVEVDPDEVAFWTCPMHPSVKEATPGQCPICHMDLTPVTHAQLERGGVTIDAVRRQRFGIRTTTVARAPLEVEVRAVGEVVVDERRITDLTVRVQGWVEELLVAETGATVREGQPVLRLYSPELEAVQRELLIAARGNGSGLADEARRRLRRFGMTDRQIDAVLAAGRPSDTVTVHAPASGVVVEKDVVAGDEVAPGAVLLRIADLGRVWVEAAVYEQDLGRVAVGDQAVVELAHLPDEVLEGQVHFVRPSVDPVTRTVPVRVELDNPGTRLFPGMYATVRMRSDLGERLQVPQESVIYTGTRRIVFVDRGDDLLEPREVRLGARGGGRVEVISGLEEGEVVVSSGVFLVASESRLRAATTYWGGHGHP